MFKKLCCEWKSFCREIRTVCLFSFLCALGGVILWVEGGGIPYRLSGLPGSTGSESLFLEFIICLITYALFGVIMGLTYRMLHGNFCRIPQFSSKIWALFFLEVGVYLLNLIWYAIFFCTHLHIFALIIILISLAATVYITILSSKFSILITAVSILLLITAGIFTYLNIRIL